MKKYHLPLIICLFLAGIGKSWGVYAQPVDCPDDFSLCVSDDPLDLTPLSDYPGPFSGTGVVMNTFYPSIAHAGSHTITHTYTIGMTSFSCTFVITVDSTFECLDSSKMEWVFLPPGSTNGSCESNSNCCEDTLCYGLKYTPFSTGTLTSYTTGFFVPCVSGLSPVDSNHSCVMHDNSFEINGCATIYNSVLFNSSGNGGNDMANMITTGVPLILHKVCFYVPAGDTLVITEDAVTDLTASVKLNNNTFVTEHPSFEPFSIYRTGPVMPPNGTATVQCIDDAEEPAYVDVLDQCGGHIIPTLDSVRAFSPLLTCEGTVIYYYTYTDCGGLSTQWRFIYTVDRTTPPSVFTPAPMSAIVSCINLAVPPALPVIHDRCGVTIFPAGSPAIGGMYDGCEGTKTYTYTYIDCAGLSFTWTFVYTIERVDFTIPPDGSMTVSCPAATNTPPTLPLVTDQCGNTLSPFGMTLISPQVMCEGTRTYTYTYMDCEGNSHPWVFTYIVERTEFATPPNGFMTVSCPAEAEVIPTPPVVTDNCGTILTAFDTSYSSIAVPCEGNKIYVFTYIDCEGNMATWTFTYTIERLVFVNPPDITIEVDCPADTDLPPTAYFPVVLDNCNNVLTPSAPVVSAPVSCEGLRTYTYLYTDCEGNTQDWKFTYRVERKPFTVPANGMMTVNCPADANVVPTAFLPVVLSDCGDTLAPFLFSSGSSVSCEGTRTYVYRYQDCELNTQFWSFIYTVDRMPLINPVDAGTTVACPSATNTPPTAFLPVVTDNCGVTLSPSGPPTVSPFVCTGTRTYTYLYSDCAGNSADWVYTYTILPNNTLAIRCPANLVLNCTTSNYAPIISAWLASATATDACDAGPVITNNYDGMSIPAFSCTGGLQVTFTATDNCGNTATCVSTITKPCFNLETWVYLEGSAASTNATAVYTLPMRSTLNDLRKLPGQLSIDPFFGNQYSPPGQPYSGTPWFYPGTEGSMFDSGNNPMNASAGYPPTVVDWVLVNMRNDSAGTGGPACQAAALLHKDGTVQFVQPLACCAVSEDSSYYVTIEHRNHLIVMSHVKQPFVNHKLSYDFRFQQSYVNPLFAMLNIFAQQKEIQPGKFAMFAGNSNQSSSANSDTDINIDDRSVWESQNGTISAYKAGDFNMNGDINANDRIVWERNNGKFTSVPR